MDTLTRHYSDRLGTLTGAQLQAAADRFGLGRVTGAEPASGGLFGQNVVLTTTEGRFVLRGHPHGHPQLVKERIVARLVHEHSSLPAPWPYEICDDPSLFGWTYAVMPCLPGTNGWDLWNEASPNERIALASAHGEAAARLHEVTAQAPGPFLWNEAVFVPVPDFAAWTLEQIDWWREGCRASNGLEPEDERFIDDVLSENADALRTPLEPVLVHHDFSFGNVAFVRTDGGYEASGVFDLMEAHFGDGEEDLARMLRAFDAEQGAAFVRAYTRRRPFRDGAAARITIYGLRDWLVIWEYAKRNDVWFHDGTFRERAERYLAHTRATVDAAG